MRTASQQHERQQRGQLPVISTHYLTSAYGCSPLPYRYQIVGTDCRVCQLSIQAVSRGCGGASDFLLFVGVSPFDELFQLF